MKNGRECIAEWPEKKCIKEGPTDSVKLYSIFLMTRKSFEIMESMFCSRQK